MDSAQKKLFELLREAVSRTYLETHSAPEDIGNWKGEEITGFQEDLFEKTKGRVSEKWFYTYFKNDADKLPRIDMLNLLSGYAGYKNWNDFKQANSEVKSGTNRTGLKLWYSLAIIPLAFIVYSLIDFDHTYEFCMVDEDYGEPISEIALSIKVLVEGESPIYMKTDSTGCFQYTTSEKTIRFVIQSPYHKTDTIVRHIESNKNAIVPVATDDYAVILKYYSSGNTNELQKRRKQLANLISDEAQIFQVYPNSSGIEMYSKEEFINKLTIPTSSLKNIRILDKRYADGKIVKLKFSTQ
ncbi:hypothetical protein J1N09_14000 [Aureitalea sp. L0-47]|uniref:hypothetical protein n=1 Tax=Aureitalea sp. L0-47 TaxID=2816962 RepID=UPI0022382AD9|nr:hypothetical protein [Aureitalea sp. L0-47]MCW5520958.1 hypothetical protein [Aureitalea sp. L0-47]